VARGIDKHPTSSAFIRLISPLSYGLIGKKVNLYIYSPSEAINGFVESIDICIVQRTAFDSIGDARKFVGLIKEEKIKLVVDTDDAFSRLDKNHPQYEIQKNLTEALQHIFNNADKVWASTKDLAKEIGNGTVVFENTLDKRVWGKIGQSVMDPGDEIIKMIYMGTGTHDADFQMILPALDKINEKYNSRLQLNVIGVAANLPDRQWIKKLVVIKGLSMYPRFVEWFMQQGPFDIGLAPLENSEFNKAKSDIKVLDYLYQGTLPVVSDIEPYRNPEIDNFIVRVGYGANDWYAFFEDLLLHKEKYAEYRKNNLKKIRKYLKNDRSTRVLAKKMYKELKKLM
jgi:hypothetical protein